MKLNILLGTLFGFSIVFIVGGLWTGEFNWGLWISMLIGGTIGHLIIAYLIKNRTDKDSKDRL